MNKFKISDDIYTIGLRDSDNLQSVKENLKVKDLLFMNQIHSSDIIDGRIESNYKLLASGNATADGFIINRKKLTSVGLVVKTADCLPIFFIDEYHCVGIHAGWKGLADGIHFRLLDFFTKSELSKIEVVIGPHAINNYEVKNDVLEEFKAPVYIKNKGKTFLNMQETLSNDLIKMGINIDNIHKTDFCTISNTKLYSYRRNNLEKKRNLNVFLIK